MARTTQSDDERELPCDLDAERFALGAAFQGRFLDLAAKLNPDDFFLEKHKRIFQRMSELYDRGDHIDRVTLANELKKRRQLQSVDGLSYLVSLDDGLPQQHNLEAYIRIIIEKSSLRRITEVSDDATKRALTGEGSPTEIAGELVAAAMDLAVDRSKSNGPYRVDAIVEENAPALLDPSRANSEQRKGVESGFKKLDEKTGGFRPGELIIVAARPAMGKTAFALNITSHVARHPSNPKAVAFFSFEMSKESLLSRLVCASARVDNSAYRAGYLNDESRRHLVQHMDAIGKCPLYLDDEVPATLSNVHFKLKNIQQQEDLGMVVVDYLQLMSGRGRFSNRQEEISQLSRGFKLLAKEMKVPFVVLSQCSRAPETRASDHRPMLSDLRESGSIEQDADMVIFIFREEVYKPDKESLRGLAEAILAKQRNGPIGTVKLAYLSKYTSFHDYESEEIPYDRPISSSPPRSTRDNVIDFKSRSGGDDEQRADW